MIINLMASLRSIGLVLIALFSPIMANAYTSSGADGLFQPLTSVTFNSTQSIFNFTDISIPIGVTIDFSGITSAQPIELLSTGNIDIAGTINMGSNNLWIETPGNLSFSGTLNGSGNSLSMIAGGTVNFTGTINMPNAITPTLNGGPILSGGGTISLAPVPEPSEWAMFTIGIFVLFAVLRLSNKTLHLT